MLLQVVLHARMAEDAEPALDRSTTWPVTWSTKLVRRNPHVFADEQVGDVDEIMENWERIKREEKARDSALDGIALGQPALALAAKILSRAQRAGIAVRHVPAPPVRPTDEEDARCGPARRLVAAARAVGLDPEAALRRRPRSRDGPTR